MGIWACTWRLREYFQCVADPNTELAFVTAGNNPTSVGRGWPFDIKNAQLFGGP